jgi:hypothetical protein
MNKLPTRLLAYLLGFTETESMLAVKLVCKKWLRASSDDLYYSRMLAKLLRRTMSNKLLKLLSLTLRRSFQLNVPTGKIKVLESDFKHRLIPATLTPIGTGIVSARLVFYGNRSYGTKYLTTGEVLVERPSWTMQIVSWGGVIYWRKKGGSVSVAAGEITINQRGHTTKVPY